MSVSVCLCLSVCDHISATTRPIFTNVLCMLHITVARGPPLAAQWYVMYFRFYG